MLPDNIDDLFRQQLGGHATPPPADLWARLQVPAAAADPVDTAFQEGLRGYAPPPRREVWERLEDEHLRPQPRRRRVVAWWQLSAAAMLLLMLLAGGGLLWRGHYLGGAGNGVAHLSTPETHRPAGQSANTTTARPPATQPVTQKPDLATAIIPNTAAPKKNQDFSPTQATTLPASTSSTPIATTRPPRPATATAHRASSGFQLQSSPRGAAGTLARRGARHTPANQSSTTPTPTFNSVLTPAAHDNIAPTLAVAPPAVAPAAAPEIIEVEVRRGTTRPAPAPAVVAVADAPAAPARRPRLRLGGLLRQADHLVHGEPVSLAEATGLPETLTLQARLGGRVVSKTIQL